LQQALGECLGDPLEHGWSISNWRFEQLAYDEVQILEIRSGALAALLAVLNNGSI
jgi:hypothetical protein